MDTNQFNCFIFFLEIKKRDEKNINLMLNRKMFRWPLVSILCIIFVFVMATWIMNIQSNNIQNSPGFRISIFLVAFLIIGIIVKKFIINKIDPQMEAFKNLVKSKKIIRILVNFFENVTGEKDLKGNKKSNKKIRVMLLIF